MPIQRLGIGSRLPWQRLRIWPRLTWLAVQRLRVWAGLPRRRIGAGLAIEGLRRVGWLARLRWWIHGRIAGHGRLLAR